MESPSMPPRSAPPAQPLPGLPVYAVDQDTEHLKVLSICYYVMSGLSVLSALAFAVYIVLGGMMLSRGMGSGGGGHRSAAAVSELNMMGGMMLLIGIGGTFVILTIAILEFIVARKLVRRESKVLCFIVAGINCLNMPLGTVLGVFTFLVLSRPSVAESFERNSLR